MDEKKVINNLKLLFYQSRFNDVIKSITEEIDFSLFSPEAQIEIKTIEASSLFELNEKEKSKEVLKNIILEFPHYDKNFTYLYSLSRLAYMDKNYELAKESFETILFLAQEKKWIFRGHLGMSNLFYTLNDRQKMKPHLEALMSFNQKEMDPSDWISYQHLLANFYKVHDINLQKSEEIFKRSLQYASEHHLKYWVQKSIYGWATVLNARGNDLQTNHILEVLELLSDKNENIFFLEMIREKLSTPTSIEINHSQLKIKINNKWHDFHQRPHLFYFLSSLQPTNEFVSKKELAKKIWPNENYLPRTHDPRLLDIAKRVRIFLEQYAKDSFQIISGRMGYQLIKFNVNEKETKRCIPLQKVF